MGLSIFLIFHLILIVMEIIFNGEVIKLPHNKMSLKSIIDLKAPGKKGIAVSINGKLVPKKEWEAVYPQNLDDILLFTGAFGG